MLAKGTLMLCLYYYVLLMSSYILKMFLLAMFEKLIIVLLELSLCFETAVKQFEKELHKDALEKNCRNQGDTRRCFNVIKCLYDVA